MDSVLLFFSLCFPMLAGHDLLDHVPTEAYWKDKHIAISGEAMLAQLQVETTNVDATQLIRELGDPDFDTREKATQALIEAGSVVASQVEQAMLSDDPEVVNRAKRIAKLLLRSASESKARQLMAVRTLGELRFAAAEPQLTKLAGDRATKPALARYARRALEQIREPRKELPLGKRVLPTAEELLSDMKLLPANSNSIVQVSIAEPLLTPLNPALDFKPFFGSGIPAEQREPTYLAKLIALADTVGDVRIDAATAAFIGAEEEKKAFLTCVVRGAWDSEALRTLLSGGNFSYAKVEGQDVYSFGAQCKILLMSEQRMVITYGETLDELPLKSLLTGGEATDLLPQNKKLWSLVEKRDFTKPIWGAMLSAELFPDTPWLKPFDLLTLSGEQRQAELKLTIDAHAADQTKVDAALVEFEKMLDKAEPEAGQIAAMFRCAKPLAELMESLKTVRNPQGVSVTMQTPNFAPLLALPLVLTHNEWLK